MNGPVVKLGPSRDITFVESRDMNDPVVKLGPSRDITLNE